MGSSTKSWPVCRPPRGCDTRNTCSLPRLLSVPSLCFGQSLKIRQLDTGLMDATWPSAVLRLDMSCCWSHCAAVVITSIRVLARGIRYASGIADEIR
jgi:hypothetical protein